MGYITLKDENSMQDRYGSLTRVMWTLLVDGTFTDSLRDSVEPLFELEQTNTIIGALIILVFVFLSAITMLNMLIGVICEVVSSVTVHERDDLAIQALKTTIVQQLLKFDEDDNGCISKKELKGVMEDPTVNDVLVDLEVDLDQLHSILSSIFAVSDSELPVERVMDLVFLCRKNLPLTFAHVSELAFATRWSFSKTLESEVQRAVEGILGQLAHRLYVCDKPVKTETALVRSL